MDLVLIAAAIFIGLKIFDQANILSDKLNYSFTGLKWAKKSTDVYTTGFETTMVLKNPTNISATITSISGTANLNNTYNFSNYTVNQTFTIPANGSVNVPLFIGINNLETAKALLFIFSSAGKTAIINLSGTINTTIGAIPFTYKLN